MDGAWRRARAQLGAIDRRQLLREGWTERKIQWALERGELVTVLPGVYRFVVVPETREGDLIALQLWGGDDSFFSHRAGAEILGLDGVPLGIDEICTSFPLRYSAVKVHRIARDDKPPVHHHGGLRVAHPERVLLDLAAVVPYRTLGLCIDDALRKKITTVGRLHEGLARYGGPGKNGTRAFRRMIEVRDDTDGRLASMFEGKMRRILKRIGRPHEAQHPVTIGESNFFLDFAFPEIKLGIECHSIKWHLGEDRFKKDVRRDRALRRAGWTILYFLWDDVALAPAQVEQEIRETINSLLVSQRSTLRNERKGRGLRSR